MLIPDEAIGADQNERIVYEVTGDGSVVTKPVRLGPKLHGYRVIRSGMTGDETIVVNGLMRARPGTKVKPEMVQLPRGASGGDGAMRFAHFFVDRPIFASVLSIVLLIVGSIAYFQLPVAQYPEIAPPTIVVRAAYPGADADTVANTVATPLEQEINGVENMLYMSSYSTADGSMALTITFKLGTDLDQAQVLVQNRVSIAEPRLPEEVRRIGITTAKSSPDLMMVVHLLADRTLRPALRLELCTHAHSRPAGAARRRRRRHPVRRARICTARLARSGKAFGLWHDGGRCRAGASRTERAGLRRLDRWSAGAG